MSTTEEPILTDPDATTRTPIAEPTPIVITDETITLPEPKQNTVKPKAVKAKKPRKPMSEEHKAKLLAGLVKAREASAVKRGLKSQAKKILKEKDDAETNELVRRSLLAKSQPDPRDVEIAELKKRLDGLTLQDVVKKPRQKKKPATIKEADEEEEEEIFEMEIEPKPRIKLSSLTSIASHIQQAPVIIPRTKPAEPPPHKKTVLRRR